MDLLVRQPKSIHSSLRACVQNCINYIKMELFKSYYPSLKGFFPILFVLFCWSLDKLLAPTHLLQTVESHVISNLMGQFTKL